MYIGPPIDDPEILERVPEAYRQFLAQTNGYIAWHGGLHVRGACTSPVWHSLRAAWSGEHALHELFAAVLPDDVPFAEDALGDQFLLRGGVVHRLWSEMGEIESLELDLVGFDAAVRADPEEILALGPLRDFRASRGELLPGQLLSVMPPFVFQESADGRSYRAIPAADRMHFLASLARQIRDLPDGAKVELDWAP